jgi:hypothetical protein
MRLMRRASIYPILGFLFLMSPWCANAQFDQYTPPGGPQDRPESREERLKREIEGARFHFGPVRLSFEGGIKDVAYVRNLFAAQGEVADVTATLGVGARAYLHTGSKVTWVARVHPEYVWWRQRSDSRRFNTSYGVEGLGFFNRVFVGVAASRTEEQRLLTPEVPTLANARGDDVQATAEVRLTGALYSFATVRQDRQVGLVDEVMDPLTRSLAFLDREEKVARGGLRWRPRTGWMLGLGAERTQVDFDRQVLDSSNAGTAPVLEVLIDRRRFFFQVDAASRSLQARQGSRFVAFHGTTGSAAASFRARPSQEVWLYANRSLIYSLSPSYPYLSDERTGLALGFGVGGRLSSRLFVETGRNSYVAFSAAAPPRHDAVLSFGASLRLLAVRGLSINAQAVRSRYDSNLPGGDRTFTAGGLTVNFDRF